MSQNAQKEQIATLAADVPMPEEHETEIDLMELLLHLLEKVRYIILAAILGALIMGIYSFVIAVPQYESTAKLYVLSSSDSVVNLSDLQIGTYLTADYQEVFKTWEVHERVLQNMNLEYTYKQLQNMLTIANPSNTRILTVTVTSADPGLSANMANEYANVARGYIAETMATDMPNILSIALPSVIPVSPNKTTNVIMGIVVGALIAIAILVVLFLLDDKIKSADDITKYTGMPTLAVVPLLNEENLLRIQKLNATAQKKNGGRSK